VREKILYTSIAPEVAEQEINDMTRHLFPSFTHVRINVQLLARKSNPSKAAVCSNRDSTCSMHEKAVVTNVYSVTECVGCRMVPGAITLNFLFYRCSVLI